MLALQCVKFGVGNQVTKTERRKRKMRLDQITCKASQLPSIFPAISLHIRSCSRWRRQQIVFVSELPLSAVPYCHPASSSSSLEALSARL